MKRHSHHKVGTIKVDFDCYPEMWEAHAQNCKDHGLKQCEDLRLALERASHFDLPLSLLLDYSLLYVSSHSRHVHRTINRVGAVRGSPLKVHADLGGDQQIVKLVGGESTSFEPKGWDDCWRLRCNRKAEVLVKSTSEDKLFFCCRPCAELFAQRWHWKIIGEPDLIQRQELKIQKAREIFDLAVYR